MRKLFIIVISISLFTILSYKANATDVGGIISSDTIWSISGSPYNVTSLIQIAPNVTVTIEPGVIINRAGGAHIQVFGGLIAIGTEISKIIINDIRIYGEDDNLTLPIHVEYAVFNDGGFSTGYCKKNLILRNSILKNNTAQTLIYYPESETYIEKNIFDNWGGISINGNGSGKVCIKNNVFFNVTYNNGSAIQIAISNSSSNPVILNNSFLTYATEHPAMSCLHGVNVTASNNYWNTTDTNIIDLMIKDRNDNLNIDNYILYTPFLTEPDSNTPIFLPNRTLTIQSNPSDANTLTPSVGQHIVSGMVDISANKYINCPDVYLFDHWEGNVSDPNSSSTTVFMDSDKTITAVFTATRECGDDCHPNDLFGDYNHDCIIDMTDFAQFALNWLTCTKPECD